MKGDKTHAALNLIADWHDELAKRSEGDRAKWHKAAADLIRDAAELIRITRDAINNAS
jgi:hypothetical protein